MATPQLTVYDFDQVTVAIGPILVDGFQEGEGVTIAQDAQIFTKVIGADGKVTRSKTLNRAATVTINTLQSSAANDLLSALALTDMNAPNGAGIVPLFIRDRSGRGLYKAAQCWIESFPEVSFGNEATPRAWVIGVAKLERFDGGN